MKNGNPTHKPPKVPRPPVINAIWHNAFHEQITQERGRHRKCARRGRRPFWRAPISRICARPAREQSGLATSIREAIQVSRRIGPRQLGIPLNAPAERQADDAARAVSNCRSIGGMSVTVLGPTEGHLRKLREEWNEWLRDNQESPEGDSGHRAKRRSGR